MNGQLTINGNLKIIDFHVFRLMTCGYTGWWSRFIPVRRYPFIIRMSYTTLAYLLHYISIEISIQSIRGPCHIARATHSTSVCVITFYQQSRQQRRPSVNVYISIDYENFYISIQTHTHTQMLLPVFRRFALGCNNFSEEWKRWPFVVESNYFDIRPWYCRNLHRYKSQAVAAIILSSLIRLSPGVWATLNLFISHYGRDICMPFIDWSFNLESPEASRGVSSSSLLYTSPPLHTTACTQREREREEEETRLNFHSIGSTGETGLHASWNNSTGSTTCVTIHHSKFSFFFYILHRRLFIDWSFSYCS